MAPLDVGCLEVGCIDGIDVVGVVGIVSDGFAGDVVVGRIIGKP